MGSQGLLLREVYIVISEERKCTTVIYPRESLGNHLFNPNDNGQEIITPLLSVADPLAWEGD